jgi:hypothetical protein
VHTTLSRESGERREWPGSPGGQETCSGEHSRVRNTGYLPCIQEQPSRQPLQPLPPGTVLLLGNLSTGITNSPMPRGLNSQFVIWSKSHHDTFHILHVLLHHEVLCTGGHSQDIPGTEELEEASAKTPSCPPSKFPLSHNSNSLHPHFYRLTPGDPKALWPQRWGLALGPAAQKAITCLGSSLPSHTACNQGIETKARRAAVRRITFILREVQAHYRMSPTRKQLIYLSALVWVVTTCLDIIPIFLKAKLLRVEEGAVKLWWPWCPAQPMAETRETQEPVLINSTVPISCLSTPSFPRKFRSS